MKAGVVLLGLLVSSVVTCTCSGQDVPCFEDVIVSELTFDCANGAYTFSSHYNSTLGDYETNLGLRPSYSKILSCHYGMASISWDAGWQLEIRFKPSGWLRWVHLLYTNAATSYEPPARGWIAERMYCPYWCYDDSPHLSGGERCGSSLAELALVKSWAGNPVEAGDTIEYSFEVENTGDVTLYDISVYDDALAAPVMLDKVTLEPGETASGKLIYTVTQADIDAGGMTNRALAQATTSGGDSVTASDSTSVVLVRHPEMFLRKTAQEGPFYEGDTARFTFTLTNTGNVTLERLTLHDEGMSVDISLTVNSLSPGASITTSVDYIVAADDAARGQFTNAGSAEGWTNYGVRVEADGQATIVCLPYPEDDEDAEVLENLTIGIDLAPSLSLAADCAYCQGETINAAVDVLDGTPVAGVMVYVRLYAGDDADRTTVVLEEAEYENGEYTAPLDTALLEAGAYSVRAWAAGTYTELLPVTLQVCGDNVDGDGVSDSVDACPEVAVIATNAGCPRGDLDYTGIPDYLECEGGTLVEAAYPVRIVVETSSDWTTVSLEHGEILLISAERDGSPMWGYTGLLDMRVTRPCCQSNTVRVLYDAYLFALDMANLEWSIAKGGFGRSTLSIYTYPDPAKPDSEFELLYESRHWRDVGVDDTVDPRTDTQAVSEIIGTVKPITLDESCAKVTVEPLVLALYSTGYGTPDGPAGAWESWRPDRTNHGGVDLPVDGPYDSSDANIIAAHLDLAVEMGIDALVCSWSGGEAWEDTVFGLLLDAAAEAELRVAIYLESSRLVTESLAAFNSAYGDHAALLRVEGRPVVFFRRNMRSSIDWEEDLAPLRTAGFNVFGVLDGIDLDRLTVLEGFALDPMLLDFGETFDISRIAEKADRASLLAKMSGNIFVAVVCPGGIGQFPLSGDFGVPRENGDVYRMMWDAAIASDPDWILIHSFNLWLDGSEIEPSVEYNNTYIDLTRQYIQEWRALE